VARDRYGYRRKPSVPRQVVVLVVLLAAIGGAAWWHFGREDTPPTHSNGPDGTPPKPPNGPNVAQGNGNGNGSRSRPNGSKVPKPPKPTNAQQAEAVKLYTAGMKLLNEKKPFEARRYLSQALLSGHLPTDRDTQAAQALMVLANEYILSPRADERDAYAKEYVLTGDDSKGLAAVERKLKLHVPWQAIIIVSDARLSERVRKGLDLDLDKLEARSRGVRVGQRLKTIPGPCHAVIYRSRHLMDLYLHREGGDRVFVRRVPVGLGKYKGTPTGKWKVVNKQVKGDYYPAPNSPLRPKGTIPYGQPDYAFGKKGLWLGLEGTSEETKGLTGYGIHSTSHQDSIGRDESEGCIRVGDNHIDLVFCMLYEKWATVDIRP